MLQYSIYQTQDNDFFIKTNATIMLSPDISLSDHVSTIVGQARSQSNEMLGYWADKLKHIQ